MTDYIPTYYIYRTIVMGLKKLQVTFDNAVGVYFPGQTVQGQVLATIKGKMKKTRGGIRNATIQLVKKASAVYTSIFLHNLDFFGQILSLCVPKSCGQYLIEIKFQVANHCYRPCLLYTSPSPRDRQKSRMPSSA